MAIEKLRELFIEIGNNYLNAVEEEFTGHPLAKIIRNKPKEIIFPIISNQDLTIKGSAGMGNWTSSPWIAILNKDETDGAQEGIYVVYLFSEDMKRVYLTFNQGVTNPIQNDGRKIAFQKLKAKAIDIRTNFDLRGFNSDNKIHLASSGLGSDYEKATIFYKEYKIDDLPANEALMDDLKQIVSFYNEYLEPNALTAGTDFREFSGGVEEGKRRLKKHYVRERNPKIIKEAKKLALERFGELKCEICGFSFKEHYGDRAKDFIEGHHKKPIAEMQEGGTTSPNDIALVCSNCHRVIHLKMPWLTIEEIAEIYN